MKRTLLATTAIVGLGGLLVSGWMKHPEVTAGARLEATAKRIGPSFKTQIAAIVNSGRALADHDEPAPIAAAKPTYQQRLESNTHFRAFVTTSHLTSAQTHTFSHILALFYRNEEAIDAAAVEQDKAAIASMRRQLLGDTVAQIQARLPEGTWEKFAPLDRSGGATDDSAAIALSPLHAEIKAASRGE